MARRVSLLLALLLLPVAAPGPAGASPTVTVTSPTEGRAVSGTVRLDVDAPAGTVRVDYYVSRVWVAADATPKNGFGEAWDSGRALDGDHTVIARATSPGGSVLSEPVAFTVANEQAAPAPAPTTPPADPQPAPPPPGRQPAPPPSGNRGPSGPTLVWADNFDRGLDCAAWRYVGNADYAGGCSGAPSGMTRLTFPADGPGRAARFEVRADDRANSGERSEIDTGSAALANIFREGDTRWLQGRLKLPADFTSGPGFVIFAQFHAGVGSPPASLSLADDGALQVGGNCDTVIILAAAMRAARDAWIDFSLKVDFSTSASKGGVDAWAQTPDGTAHDPARTACPTMADGDSYLKVGQYRSSGYSHTGVVYLDDLALSRD